MDLQQIEVRTFITVFLLILDIWATATFGIYLLFRRTVGFRDETIQLISWLMLYFGAQSVSRGWAWYLSARFKTDGALGVLDFEFRYGVTLAASIFSAIGIANAVRLLTKERFGGMAWFGVGFAAVSAFGLTALSV